MKPFFICLGLILFLMACSPQQESQFEQTPEDLPDEISENFHYIASRLDKKEFEIFARQVARYQDKRSIEADSLWVLFFDENGNQVSTLAADSGQMNEYTYDIEAFGNVEIRTAEGSVLFTEKIFWKRESNQIYAPEKVHVQKEQDHIYGQNLITDPQLSHIEMKEVYGQGEREEWPDF